MTGDELKAARKQLGLSTQELGDALGLASQSGSRSVRAMESGRREVSGPVSKVIECLLHHRMGTNE